MSNYTFEENGLLGITSIYKKGNNRNILIGFIHHNLKIFIYTNSPEIKFICNKKNQFEIEKQISFYENELNSLNKLFPNKQRKKDLIYDIENNKKRLENLSNDKNHLDVEDLIEELKEKGLEILNLNQGYALLPKEFSLNNTETLINEKNLNHIWDMNYFKMYNLLSVKENKDFMGTNQLLTKNFIKRIIGSNKVEILDIKLDYNFFFDEKDEKIKHVEQGLKLIMHNKEVFNSTMELYTNSFVEFNYLVGVYDGLPFIIKDNILFTNSEGNLEKYSSLMFDISIYSKN